MMLVKIYTGDGIIKERHNTFYCGQCENCEEEKRSKL
jgi:hypothetical protein